MGIVSAVRAVLLIRTNVILIVAGACGYFYLSGVETFGTEFAREQFKVDQALANFLLLIVGGGAVVGVLVSGDLSDRLLQRGFLNSRILVAALCALGATVLFIPALTTRSPVTALPYLILAGLMLSAQNPPIDAARLDIVPALLWGRAEATRTVLRSLAQSLAPLLFGAVSDHVFGGGRSGLQWTFGIMLIAMGGSGVILLRAMRTYPQDVATAGGSVLPSAAADRQRPRRRHAAATGSAAATGARARRGRPGRPRPLRRTGRIRPHRPASRPSSRGRRTRVDRRIRSGGDRPDVGAVPTEASSSAARDRMRSALAARSRRNSSMRPSVSSRRSISRSLATMASSRRRRCRSARAPSR